MVDGQPLMASPSEMESIGFGTRFRSHADWFVAGRIGTLFMAQVGTTGERAVDLLHALAFHLDPAVDVVIDSARDGQAWHGSFLALPDVRDAIGRLKLTLSTYGGVEISVFTPDDQLSLTPELSLVVYARTDRWLYLLEGMGLEERSVLPQSVWKPSRHRLAPAPELSDSVRAAVDRLALAPMASSFARPR
jgi:hypothetical protein